MKAFAYSLNSFYSPTDIDCDHVVDTWYSESKGFVYGVEPSYEDIPSKRYKNQSIPITY